MLDPALCSLLLPLVPNAFAGFILFSTKSWLWKRREDACVDLFVISWNIPPSVFRNCGNFMAGGWGSCLLPVEMSVLKKKEKKKKTPFYFERLCIAELP